MALGPSRTTTPLISRSPEGTAWLARAFQGLRWQHIGILIALCAIWAASTSTHDVLRAWDEDRFLDWLIGDLGLNFASAVAVAFVMAVPIVVVANLGPRAGWRRVAALAATIALIAPVAGLVRYGGLLWLNDAGDPQDKLANLLVMFWFRYALQAALVTIVAEFHRRETRSVEAMHQAEIDRLALDREMDEARLQVLQAQIEPHFLFNTLANVRRLYQMDLTAGRSMLDNLMRYLEVALPRMREERSTVGRELTLVEAYLNVQGIRMGRRLAFEIDAPQGLHALDLPPMMLLTLVENAIKHGLNPVPGGGTIRIIARRDGTQLRIDVVDDGRGFHDASGGGTGLANIRARLSAMHADGARLTLTENQPRGVTSTLSLPVVEEAEAPA